VGERTKGNGPQEAEELPRRYLLQKAKLSPVMKKAKRPIAVEWLGGSGRRFAGAWMQMEATGGRRDGAKQITGGQGMANAKFAKNAMVGFVKIIANAIAPERVDGSG
jgi:hypothetical protein